jgi:hypothetical protein
MLMERLLDPRSDLVFKRIFGEHPEILRSFLNALLPFEGRTRRLSCWNTCPVSRSSAIGSWFLSSCPHSANLARMRRGFCAGPGCDFCARAGDAGRPGHASTEQLVSQIAVSGRGPRSHRNCPGKLLPPGELEAYDRFWDFVRRERTLISGSRQEGIEEGIGMGLDPRVEPLGGFRNARGRRAEDPWRGTGVMQKWLLPTSEPGPYP